MVETHNNKENNKKENTNKKDKTAIALRYKQEEDNAPVVVAAGEGWLAKKIMEIAKEEGISVFEDKDLVDSLKLLKIGEEIPVELYEAVASIMAFVFSVDAKQEGKRGSI